MRVRKRDIKVVCHNMDRLVSAPLRTLGHPRGAYVSKLYRKARALYRSPICYRAATEILKAPGCRVALVPLLKSAVEVAYAEAIPLGTRAY